MSDTEILAEANEEISPYNDFYWSRTASIFA